MGSTATELGRKLIVTLAVIKVQKMKARKPSNAILLVVLLTTLVPSPIHSHPGQGLLQRFARQADLAEYDDVEGVEPLNDEVLVSNEVNAAISNDDDEKGMSKPDVDMDYGGGDVDGDKIEDFSENDLSDKEKSTSSTVTISTTTTTTTTTTARTTRVRVQPLTTTRRTTTTRRPTTTQRTTQPPPPPPSDPGILGRIGSFFNQGVGNIGSNIISGGTLMAAAAAPLWAPLLVGKKRRKRDILSYSNNEVDVNKRPVEYYAKLIHSNFYEAKKLRQGKKKSN